MSDARAAFEAIWSDAGGDPAAMERVVVSGADPVLPSVFKVGTAAVASIAAESLAAAEIWRRRTGREQTVDVDMRRALASYRSERYLLLDGKPARDIFDPIHGFYRCRDGRWIQLHTNYAQHRIAVTEFFRCAMSRPAVEHAVAQWDGFELEDALAARTLPCGVMRRPEEWRAHPQAQVLGGQPLVEITRIGDAPPMPLPRGGDGPLSGVRALDLTKVIAGPLAGRTLAEHGAEVLTIAGKHMTILHALVMDQGRGKRAAWLDLRRDEGRERLRALAREADIFVQGYRPGTIAGRGFGPEALAEIRPGIVYVSLSAFGHEGPWTMRRGFDSIVQQVSGIAWEGAASVGQDGPKHLPCQALDHSTGYLAAFGAMMALMRRAEEGGSWLVRISLARTGRWLDGLGRVPGGMEVPETTIDDVADLLETQDGPYGRLTGTVPAAVMSETPGRWELPAAPYGTHAAAWAA